jgi:hypothetical protein
MPSPARTFLTRRPGAQLPAVGQPHISKPQALTRTGKLAIQKGEPGLKTGSLGDLLEESGQGCWEDARSSQRVGSGGPAAIASRA